MPDFVQAILVAVGFCFIVGCSGAAFAFGVATVCRWLGWAPVNLTVNITNETRRSADGRE